LKMSKILLALAFSGASVFAAEPEGSYVVYEYLSTDETCATPNYAKGQVIGGCKYYGNGDETSNKLISCTDYGDHIGMIEHQFYDSIDCTGDYATWRYNETKNQCDGTYRQTFECSTVGGYPKVADFDSATTVISKYENSKLCSGPAQEFSVNYYTVCDLLNVNGNCYDYDGSDDDTDDYDSQTMVSYETTNSPCASLSVSFCFQSESVINYRGKDYTMEQLKAGKEPECKVPHTPQSRGVVISTSCNKTVRVTDTHLIATSTGFQTAVSLKEGDVLFGSMDDDVKCTVLSNKKETSGQQYFGLNCLHSEVLVDGIRASTFGDFHTLPSWYMYYSGMVVGPDLASRVGAYVAEWYMALTN